MTKPRMGHHRQCGQAYGIKVPKVETEVLLTTDLQPRHEAVRGSEEAACCAGRSSSVCLCSTRFLRGDHSLSNAGTRKPVTVLERVTPSESQLPDPAFESLSGRGALGEVSSFPRDLRGLTFMSLFDIHAQMTNVLGSLEG